ncbi:MAG: M28 family peptidase [Woeseiaceae bacterium]
MRACLPGKSAAAICVLATLLLPWVCNADDDTEALIAALLGQTPILDDLQRLTDTIGGRPTGSPANRAAVDWAQDVFRSAGVPVTTEEFEMPMQWQEIKALAVISGDVDFQPRVVAMPFSTGTGAAGLAAPLVYGGTGSEADFARLGAKARGAWLLFETPVLDDDVGLDGLFAEYTNAAAVEPRAFNAGAAGIVFMSSRPRNLLYRHNAALGIENRHPNLIMERENAERAARLLQNGSQLSLRASIEVDRGEPYTARNVIGEIRGSSRAGEIVLFGAHLDSFDLGTGALDNGANVAMLIDIARQIERLRLKPARTIRFVLWNGEEQGLVGSWRYTEQHEEELDDHVVAASFDIGTGAITGFFTNGRTGLVATVDEYLRPVAGLGPFLQVNVPVVGTDNFDFMIEGVPNLIANQADANYASNYHAQSDTFDKVDRQQLKLNSAIAASIVWGFANGTTRLQRQSHTEIAALIANTDLEQQMRNFAVWQGWAAGERGRHD